MNAKPEFTITYFNSLGDDRSMLKISFSGKCDKNQLSQSMKIYPPANINWWQSKQTSDNEVTLNGRFKPGQTYTFSLPDGFECSGRLYKPSLVMYKIPDLDTRVGFQGEGSVIERDSRQMLHVKLLNVDELRYMSTRIPPVMAPMVEMSARGAGAKGKIYHEEIIRTMRERYGKVRSAVKRMTEYREFLGESDDESKVFFPEMERNVETSYSLPLGGGKGKGNGEISLVSFNDGWPKLLRITDLAITYKIADESLLAWVTSLGTGHPVEGVSLLGFIDGWERAVYLGKTAPDGTLYIEKGRRMDSVTVMDASKSDFAFSSPSISHIVAVSDTDSTYIKVEPRGNIKAGWLSSLSGSKNKQRLLNGHVFTERGIYRPGEPVYFKGTMREYLDMKVVTPRGVRPNVVIYDAKNQKVYEASHELSEFGTFSGTFSTKSYHPLGNYTIKVIFGPDEASTASRTFQVQEFRPPRHFARVDFRTSVRKDPLMVNRDAELNVLECNISGSYYAGGPVKNGKVRWKAYYKGSKFTPSGYDEYSFGNYLPQREEILESGESILDDNGKVSMAIPIGKEVLSGTYGIEVMATVVDFDGRAASDTAVYQAKPEYLVGLSSHKSKIKHGEQQLLRAVIVDAKGKKITEGGIQVEVQRSAQIYTRKRADNGDVYWTHDEVYRKEFSAPIMIKDGEAIFDFDFQNYGDYIVKFIYKDKSGRSYSSSTDYHVEYSGYDYNRQAASDGFERLTLVVDKTRYSAGDTVRAKVLSVRKPVDLLVTVERDAVIDRRVIRFNPEKPYIEIKLGRKHSPNAYISVVATAAREDFPTYTSDFDTTPPAFMLGVLNVEVANVSEGLTVDINSGEPLLKSSPGGKVKLKLALKDSSGRPVKGEMAVGVVDESVLQMTGYSTPSLEGLLSFNSPLNVFTGDLRMDLLSQTPFGYLTNNPLTGGGGLERRPEAVTSKVRKDFSPVAYFNPSVLTGPDGMAEVEVEMPDTMTTYRVYAVACDKGSGFGSSQRDLLVVKDFYVEPGLPRFFTVGDSFKFNVNAFNKTDSPGKVSFDVGNDSLVELEAAKKSLNLREMDNALMPVKGKAVKPGVSSMSFTARFKAGLDDRVEMSVPVNSGLLLWNDLLMGTVDGASRVTYDFPAALDALRMDQIGPDEFKVELSLSGSPFMQMAEGLKYLLKYPYGCVEQTSSGVLPLAALRGLIARDVVPGIKLEDTTKFIDSGVSRLLTMQTGSGGFGYWPGDMYPHKWGTIYAMVALSASRQSGVEIPKDNMDKALEYIKNNLKNPSEPDLDFKAFGYYILALNGALDSDTLKGAISDFQKYPREGALMVLLAGKLSGQMKEDELRSALKSVLDRSLDEKRSYSFYARYREAAIALMASSAILPGSAEAGRYAAALLGSVNKQGIWTSTSDTGWSLMALGQYFGSVNFGSEKVKVSYRQAGWPWTTVSIDPSRVTSFPLEPSTFKNNHGVEISAPPGAGLLYRLAVTFPRLDMADQGYHNGFTVTKSMESMSGKGPIRVGDVVKVTVMVDVSDWRYHYVVLDDPLPAGLVAINSAIKTEEFVPSETRTRPAGEDGYDDWYDYWYEWDSETGQYRFVPNFFEIRDDRVLAFKNRIWQGRYKYTYYARAVCEGSFVVPSTKVQLMYSPDVVGYSPASSLRIEARQ